MTAGQKTIHDMLRIGPYNAVEEISGGTVCGFCYSHPSSHSAACPWPTFRDNALAVWPEWKANLNADDARVLHEDEWREV